MHDERLGAELTVKLGFVQEGTLREEFFLNGERIDTLYMGILCREFDAIAAAVLRETNR